MKQVSQLDYSIGESYIWNVNQVSGGISDSQQSIRLAAQSAIKRNPRKTSKYQSNSHRMK